MLTEPFELTAGDLHVEVAAEGGSVQAELVGVDGVLSQVVVAADKPKAPASGPLTVHPQNPRYFSDASGRTLLLVGAHTWNNLVTLDQGALSDSKIRVTTRIYCTRFVSPPRPNAGG